MTGYTNLDNWCLFSQNKDFCTPYLKKGREHNVFFNSRKGMTQDGSGSGFNLLSNMSDFAAIVVLQ